MPLIDLNGLGYFKGKENAMIADTYSASKTYAVGDYVYYSGTLYKCKTAITTAEAWTAAHWETATLANDVDDLKTALNNVEFMPFIDAFPDYFTSTNIGSKVEIIKNTIKVTKVSNSSTYAYYSIFGKRYLGQNININNVLTDADFVNIDFGANVNSFSLGLWRVVDTVVATSPNTILLATKNPDTGVITNKNAVNNSLASDRFTDIFGFFPEVQANKNFALIFRRTNANDQSTIKLYFNYTTPAKFTENYEPFNKIASKAYSVNDFFQIGGTVYKVTQPIAQGGTITPGTNCVVTTLGAEITAILNS